MIIRLDGDGFSKFTKGFRKPFDSIITKTMMNVTEELFKRFYCSFAYTQSDEITLIIPSNNGFIFSGKIQKVVSLSAGQASTLFNKYLIENIEKEKDKISKKLYNFLIKKTM